MRRKRNDHEVVDTFGGQQPDLFVDGIDQLYRLTGSHYFPGMRMEGNDQRFSANPRSLLFQLLKDQLVAPVNAIKSTDRYHGLAKNG